MTRRPPRSTRTYTLCPYTSLVRSTKLVELSISLVVTQHRLNREIVPLHKHCNSTKTVVSIHNRKWCKEHRHSRHHLSLRGFLAKHIQFFHHFQHRDRKSTRLNSSH